MEDEVIPVVTDANMHCDFITELGYGTVNNSST